MRDADSTSPGPGGHSCSGTMHRVHVTRYGDFLYLAWRDGRLPQRLNLNTGVVVLVVTG